MSPSVITVGSLRPGLLSEVHNKCLYILELILGYETNLTSNIARKHRKYQDLIRILQDHYNYIKFINISICTLGVLSSVSIDFTAMMKELFIDDLHLTYIQGKISTVTIRSTYHIFWRRGQDWPHPDLLAV